MLLPERAFPAGHLEHKITGTDSTGKGLSTTQLLSRSEAVIPLKMTSELD
jgi:hypothetical protein